MTGIISEMETKFLNHKPRYASLAKAVIDQMGGFEIFSKLAKSVSNSGDICGFPGFETNSKVVAFSINNREVILQALKADAKMVGYSSISNLMSIWAVLEGYTRDQIEEVLNHNDESLSAYIPVQKALAWYAGEIISNTYEFLRRYQL